MGTEALSRILRWVVAQTDVQVVIDPFCGRGTVLALANELGVAALGVDVDAACVKAAERLDILKLRAADSMHPVAYYLQRAADGRGKKSKSEMCQMKDTTSTELQIKKTGQFLNSLEASEGF